MPEIYTARVSSGTVQAAAGQVATPNMPAYTQSLCPTIEHTMSNENIAETVKDFIASDLLLDAVEIDNDTSLFQGRLIDSMNLVQLLSFLESTFSVKIPTHAVTVENLDSVDSIEKLVNKVRS